MQIAEVVMKNGMSSGDKFNRFISAAIGDYGCKKIIETGSYLGQGTTAAIRSAMTPDALCYSIEVNPDFHNIAKRNNEGSGINFLLGLSVPNTMIPVDLTFNVPDTVVVDHYPANRAEMYRKEVSHNVPDKLLYQCLEAFDFAPDMVILDSAGHMGFIEFQYLMTHVKGEFILCLDDTNHVKHYETLQCCKAYPDQFTILFETDEKFGSAGIKVSSR